MTQGNPRMVLRANLQGWDGERGGRRAQEIGAVCTPVAGTC